MPRLAVIADDLTGAADTGSSFARSGLITIITLGGDTPPPADVLVYSTESRHLAVSDAAAAVRQAVLQLREAHWVYKKVDSTLRGHPGAELGALMNALGERRAVVAPAFPAQRRTTIDARQHVAGFPLEQTEFRGDVRGSDLRALISAEAPDIPVHAVDLQTIRRGAEAVALALGAQGPGIIIMDAETDEDLSIIAAVIAQLGIRLSCGSAGLAHALDRALKLRTGSEPPRHRRVDGGLVLVVAGSMHSATAAQVAALERAGCPVIRPSSLTGDTHDTLGAIAQALEAHGRAVLTTSHLNLTDHAASAVAEQLALVVRDVMSRADVGGLVLTGGDVAAAACRALGTTGVWLRAEVQPGIPAGTLLGGIADGRPVVTKAGGFGGPGALDAAAAFLSRPNPFC